MFVLSLPILLIIDGGVHVQAQLHGFQRQRLSECVPPNSSMWAACISTNEHCNATGIDALG